jgi:hypothetical protein
MHPSKYIEREGTSVHIGNGQPGEIAMKNARCMHRLCFRSLFQRGRGFAFPCDRTGRVDLDGLTERARNNYLYARAMVGRELSPPVVEQAPCEP